MKFHVHGFSYSISSIHECDLSSLELMLINIIILGFQLSDIPFHLTMFSFSFILVFSLSLLFGHRLSLAHNNSLNASKTVFDVGVVLDLATPLGKMSEICISMAVADFYKTHNNYTTKLNLNWRDSNQDLVDAASKGISSSTLLLFVCCLKDIEFTV